MFGSLGLPEILFILVVALLVFGPRRLPEIGRTIGKALGEFRRATTELKRSIDTEVTLEEVRRSPPAGPQDPVAPPALEPAAAEPPAVEPAAGEPVADPASAGAAPAIEPAAAEPPAVEPDPAEGPAAEPAASTPAAAERDGSG